MAKVGRDGKQQAVVGCPRSVVRCGRKLLSVVYGFENLRVYGLAEEIADHVWEIVIRWDRLPQDTVGKQLIKSAESIGANIAEGTGRGSFADNRRFARISRGSLFGLKHWLRRAFKRKLLTQKEVTSLLELVQELTLKLSAYISSIEKKSTSLN
jgi:four helix bundle protein